MPVLDHVFLPVSDLDRSIAFYTAALAPAGIMQRVDYDGKDGPPDFQRDDERRRSLATHAQTVFGGRAVDATPGSEDRIDVFDGVGLARAALSV